MLKLAAIKPPEPSRIKNLAERLLKKDPSLWVNEKSGFAEIRNRLGWLSSLDLMMSKCDEILSFAREIKEARFNHVVLLGMGGSSLAPEVIRFVFGVRSGYPDLTVLDTTDPATINNMEHALDFNKTLFLVSTKSGATIETLSLYKYFHRKLTGIKRDNAGENFVAITDPGSPLEKNAGENKFRRAFLNPPDIGGRYSALSYFGLVPAALIGVDIKALLAGAINEYKNLAPDLDLRGQAPGDGNGAYSSLELGVLLGELYSQGVDKVTFLSHGVLESFGCWAEQLIAESTGKNNKGIVPVTGEPCGKPENYGKDRMFVCLGASSSFPLPVGEGGGEGLESSVQALKTAGLPVVEIKLKTPEDLGAEFFRWEVATVIAGSIMGINPFDEPNVQESKDNTKEVIKYYQEKGDLPPLALSSNLAKLLGQTESGDYLAIMAYIEHNSMHDDLLKKIRIRLRDKYKIATTLGYGPRFLHSTGQLHKGGANNGMFIQLTCDDHKDIAIPGEKYTFGILKAAQAQGDMTALLRKNRRAIRIHLGANVEKGLKELLSSL